MHSTRLPGLLGTIVDWQIKTIDDEERWLIEPAKRGELSVWLTREEFTFAPRDRGWSR